MSATPLCISENNVQCSKHTILSSRVYNKLWRGYHQILTQKYQPTLPTGVVQLKHTSWPYQSILHFSIYQRTVHHAQSICHSHPGYTINIYTGIPSFSTKNTNQLYQMREYSITTTIQPVPLCMGTVDISYNMMMCSNHVYLTSPAGCTTPTITLYHPQKLIKWQTY